MFQRGNKLGSTFDLAKGCGVLKGINSIDLIHDTRHPCKRLKTDGLKAMSRGFSGGAIKWKKLPMQDISVDLIILET